MAKAMTLEQLLKKTEDGILLDIQEELINKVVPATGYTHSFIRKVNRMIDQGTLCINETTYRKVYLPTFAKAVQREMACRYTMFLKQRVFVAATLAEDSCKQMTFDLVSTDKQVRAED